MIASAIQLFTRRGFDHATIDEICEVANVAPRTFFRYFSTKEQIVLHDAHVYMDVFTNAIATARASESARGTARRAMLAVAHEIEQRADEIRPRLALIRQSPVLITAWTRLDQFWRDSLTRLFERHDKPDADVLAGALVGALNAGLVRYVANPKTGLAALAIRVLDVVKF